MFDHSSGHCDPAESMYWINLQINPFLEELFWKLANHKETLSLIDCGTLFFLALFSPPVK